MARICVAEVLGCRYYCLWGGIVRTKESTMMVLTPAMVVGVWGGLARVGGGCEVDLELGSAATWVCDHV